MGFSFPLVSPRAHHSPPPPQTSIGSRRSLAAGSLPTRFATMVRALSMSSLTPGILGLRDELYVKGYEIEGLRTPFVAYRERFIENVNRTVVNVEVQLPGGMTLSLNKTWFGVVGGMSINNLGELLTVELQGKGVRPVAFSADGNVLAEDCLFSYINKNFPSKDGFISLLCMTQMIGEEDEEVLNGDD